jgi:hypothetical protein
MGRRSHFLFGNLLGLRVRGTGDRAYGVIGLVDAHTAVYP